MADQIDIDNLVRQLEQLVPALNSLSGTRAQNNQTGGDDLKKGFDKVVRSIAKLSASLDKKAKSEDDRVRSTEEFVKSIDDASDALDELTKAQKESERQAQAQLDAIQAEIAAREEAAKIARMSTAELAEKARADKMAAAQSYANAQKQAQLNRKGTDSASAMLEELGRIPHGTAALRERFEGLGGSSMGATVGLKLTTAALEGLVAGLGAYGSALYKGEIGAKTAAAGTMTFVKAVAGAAKAIGAILLLVPGFQVLGAGLLAAGFAAEKFAQYTEAAAEMSDNLYNSFQDLQKTGVIGAGAMSEVAESARRLNLGLDAVGLQKFGKLMEQNSESLALLGGSAIRGRKAFVEIGEQLTHGSTGRALMNMGMSIEQINEGTATYLALQAQTGQGQRKTTAQLQQGAMAYLKEMDGLAKLTGIQRKELENNIMKARSVEQFRAKVNAMRASGDAKQIAAADEMEKTYAVLAKQAPDVAQGFAEAASGLITSDAGRRYFMGIERNTGAVRDLTSGNIKAEEALGNMYRAADKSTREFNTLAQAGAAGDVIGNFGQMSDLAARSGQDMKKTSDEIRATQEQQMAGADGATSAQTDMRMAQMQTRDSLQNMVNVGVSPATKAMSGFSDVVNRGTTFLAKALGIEKTMDPGERQKREDAAAKQEAENLKHTSFFGKITQYGAKAVEGLAYGAGKAADAVGAEGMGGALMDWSTESKERRVQASREALQKAGKGVQDVSGGAMGGGGAAGAGGRAPGGPQGAATPGFGGGAVGGGGVGPVRGQAGGPPGGAMGVDSLFNFGSGTGSQAHFNKLDPGFQQNLINMAQEYQQTTGRKLNLNSAYRSAEEQARVNSGGRPRAAPGRSKHQQGMAADLNSNEVAFLKQSGLLGKYGFKTLSDDPPHIYMRDGGIIPARQGGTRVVAGEAGQNEAVVPLPDGKSIPVQLKGGSAGGDRTGNVIPVTLKPDPFPGLQNTFTTGFSSFAEQQKIVEGMLRPDKTDTSSLFDKVGEAFRKASELVSGDMKRMTGAMSNATYTVNGKKVSEQEYNQARADIDRQFGNMTTMFRGVGERVATDLGPNASGPRSLFDNMKNMWSGLTKQTTDGGGQLERMQGRMDEARQRHYARLADMGQKTDAQAQSASAPMASMFDRIKGMWGGLTKEATDQGSQLERMQGRMDAARQRHYARLDNQEKSGQQAQIDSTDMVSRTRARIEEARQRMAAKMAEAEKQGNVEYEVNGRKVDKQQYDAFLKNNPQLARMQEGMRAGNQPQFLQQPQQVNRPKTVEQTAEKPEKSLWERVKQSIGGLFSGLTSTPEAQSKGPPTRGRARAGAQPTAPDQQKSKTSAADIVQKSQVDPTDMVSRTRARIEAARQRMAKLEAEAEKQGTATYKVNGRSVDKKQYDAELAAAQQNLTAAQKIDKLKAKARSTEEGARIGAMNDANMGLSTEQKLAKLKGKARSTEEGARIGALNDANMGLTTEQKLAKLKGKARSTEEGARIGAVNDANMGLTAEQKLAKLREKSGQAQFSGLTRPSRDFEEVDITSQFDRINEQIKTQLPSGGLMGDDWMSGADGMTSDWLAMGEEQMARGRDAFNSATAMDPAMRPGQNLDASIKKLEESLNKTAAQTTGAGAPGAPGAPGASALTGEPTKLDGMNELLGKLSDMVSQQRTTTAAIEKMAQYQRA